MLIVVVCLDEMGLVVDPCFVSGSLATPFLDVALGEVAAGLDMHFDDVHFVSVVNKDSCFLQFRLKFVVLFEVCRDVKCWSGLV